MTAREQRLYAMTKRLVHYAACLEQECARLGNAAVTDPRNTTLGEARALLTECDGRGR